MGSKSYTRRNFTDESYWLKERELILVALLEPFLKMKKQKKKKLLQIIKQTIQRRPAAAVIMNPRHPKKKRPLQSLMMEEANPRNWTMTKLVMFLVATVVVDPVIQRIEMIETVAIKEEEKRKGIKSDNATEIETGGREARQGEENQ